MKHSPPLSSDWARHAARVTVGSGVRLIITASGGIIVAVMGGVMAYEPPFERTDAIDALCMEIAELVGMLSPQAPLATNPTLRRERVE